MGSSKEGKIRSAPAYTMTGREKPPLIPVFIFPGPGYYDGEYTVVKSKPPVYSMRGKFKVLSDDNKPGPGAHCPEKVSSLYFNFRDEHGFSLYGSQYVHINIIYVHLICFRLTKLLPRPQYWEKRSPPAISFGILHSKYCKKITTVEVPERCNRILIAGRPDKGL